MLIAAAITYHETHQHSVLATQSDHAVQSAAVYHRTKSNLDYRGSSLVAINSKMTELNFVLKVPPSLATDRYRLVGARYCNINGHLAAHLRFVEQGSARQISLFQTELVDALDELEQTSLDGDGLKVELWGDEYFNIRADG